MTGVPLPFMSYGGSFTICLIAALTIVQRVNIDTKLYNRISPHELLQMCGILYGIKKEEIDKREKEILKLLNLEELKNVKIGNLSTGQTQRVGLARCLVHNPQYYILDEATSGLDIISSQIILDFIKEEKQKGKTIFYSTHYMEEAENICDKVLMIYRNRNSRRNKS